MTEWRFWPLPKIRSPKISEHFFFFFFWKKNPQNFIPPTINDSTVIIKRGSVNRNDQVYFKSNRCGLVLQICLLTFVALRMKIWNAYYDIYYATTFLSSISRGYDLLQPISHIMICIYAHSVSTVASRKHESMCVKCRPGLACANCIKGLGFPP